MLKLNHMLFKHKYINAKGNQDELLQIQWKCIIENLKLHLENA